jgi:AraC family transcriptional regulator
MAHSRNAPVAMGHQAPELTKSLPDRGARAGTTDLQTHGRSKYPKSRLLASSAGRGWPTLAAELRSHPAGGIVSAYQQSVEVAVGIRGGDDGFVVRTNAGQQTRWTEGSAWIAPIGVDDEEVLTTAPIPKALHLYLPVRQFNLLADQYNLSRSPVDALQYIGGMTDELIRQIGLSVLSEMTEETATGLMLVETSCLMLAAHLSQNYCDGGLKPCVDTPHRLDNARLRRVLEYIQAHLDEEISVADLADVAHLSVFHFTRMFTAALGVPPHRYISRHRLENAMAMLTIGRLPLCEIAHRSRFSSQASFSRAFRRVTGVTPGEYRRRVR